MKNANTTTRKMKSRTTSRSAGKPVVHRFLHRCASGTCFEMTLEQFGPGLYGRFETRTGEQRRPGDAQEYRRWFRFVEAIISREAGRPMKLIGEPVTRESE